MSSGQEQFRRCLKLSSYALMAAGVTALMISQALGWVSGLLCLGLIGLSWRFETDWPKRHQALVFIALGGWFGLDWLLVSSAVEASLHLLLAISLVKLLGSKQDQDYGLLYAVSFLFLLISSIYTLSVLFLLVLLVYVFLAVLTVALYESRQSFEKNPGAQFQLRGYLQVSLLMAVLVGLVSAPIFIAIPRTNWGLLRIGDLQEGNLSGFSDRVVLGDIGRIIQNRDLFMRFRVDRDPADLPADLKWRGVALNFYDGLAWSNTDRSYRPLPIDPVLNAFVVRGAPPVEDQSLRQQIILEPGSDVVFVLGRALQVSALQRGLGGLVLRDQNESLRFYRTLTFPVQYSVLSELVPRPQLLERVTSGTIPASIRGRFLQLPQLDPRIAELALEVTRDAPSPVAKALVLESYLRRSFDYSLENAPAAATDPLAAFLFESREGHCEFFATAMAVMLRTLDIPSRVVNGFRAGEYNDWSGYWLVRQSDAHSWVEAFFPGAGWVEFDPTPATSLAPQPLLGRWVGQMLDAVDLFWTEVVTFDRLKQLTFFIQARQTLRSTLRSMLASLGRLDPAAWVSGLALPAAPRLLLAFGLVLAVAGAVWAFRRHGLAWFRWRFPDHIASSAPAYYLEFLDSCGRKGFARQTSETPREFASRLQWALNSPVPQKVTDLYYRHRFAKHPPSPAELAALRQEAKLFVAAIRAVKG